MALANYSDLQTTVADYLNRDDLTAQIPTFIALFEKTFSRSVKVADMEVHLLLGQGDFSKDFNNDFLRSLDLGYVSVALPSDIVAIRNVRLEVNPVQTLRLITPRYADFVNPASGGRATGYYIQGNVLFLSPATNAQVTVDYYQAVPALSNSTKTNWILTKWPDAYLFGTLMQAQLMLADDARLQTWGSVYGSVVSEIEATDKNIRWSHAEIIPSGPNP